MKYVLCVLITLAASLLVGLLVASSGIVSVSALEEGGGALDGLLQYASRRSIAHHAEARTNPLANDAAALAAGLAHYKANCLMCHTASNLGSSEFAKGLNPPAPRLTAPGIQGMSDGEFFWIVSNGIRMTGMPAFSPTHGENEIWQIVAFVRHLDHLTEKEEAQLAEGREEDAEHHHDKSEPDEHSHGGHKEDKR